MITFRLSCALVLLLGSAMVLAETSEKTALPEPLTLQAALGLIDNQHPQLRLVDSARNQASSYLRQQQALDDLSAQLDLQARWIEPSELSPYQDSDDHRAALTVNKTLYDFGRTESKINAARLDVQGSEWAYLDAWQRQHLLVTRRFFDVLLADQQFYRYNEEMAVAYIRVDRLRDRRKLGQVSDIVVAENEAEYQRIRRMRLASQNQQRVTRSLLAQALNRPNDLPASLALPELPVLQRKIPEEQPLIEEALANNPRLKNLRARLEAAQTRITSAQKNSSPVLTGQVEAFAYSRETPSTDQWRAGVTLQVPLWTGDRTDAAVAAARAEHERISARLAEEELVIRQQVLELWLKLDTLRVSRDEARAGMDYRELYLDRSRALYEMEVKTDLGDSMVQFSDAQRKVMETDFEMAMVWAQLDALTGKLVDRRPSQPEVKKNVE